jgi:hypothetical protein
MAKKRKRRADGRFTSSARKTTTKKRRYRRNPGSPPKRRRARAAAGRLIGGLNFKEALKLALPLGIGMFAAKLGAKRFNAGGSETDPASWTWRTYLQAGAGAAIAGILAQMVRPGMGQKVFAGGVALVVYKAVQNELIQKNEKAVSWLGQAETPDSGLLLDLNGDPYMLGPAGEEMPLDESHRMLLGADEVVETMYGDDGPTWGEAIAPVSSLGRFGEAVAEPSSLGFFGDTASDVMAQYRRAWV